LFQGVSRGGLLSNKVGRATEKKWVGALPTKKPKPKRNNRGGLHGEVESRDGGRRGASGPPFLGCGPCAGSGAGKRACPGPGGNGGTPVVEDWKKKRGRGSLDGAGGPKGHVAPLRSPSGCGKTAGELRETGKTGLARRAGNSDRCLPARDQGGELDQPGCGPQCSRGLARL